MRLRLLAVLIASGSMATAFAQDVTPDKAKLGYTLGYDYGRTLSGYGMEVDQAAFARGIADGLARKKPELSQQQIAQILQSVKQTLYAQAKTKFDKASTENKASSESFLAKNRTRPGVKVLPDGIQYRVIDEGTGPQVKPDDMLQIMFRATLSNGKEFVSNYSATGTASHPAYMAIKESPMAGMREILPMMRQGARWEIVLPPEQAYGSDPGSPVGPNQAVLFDIKIVDINPTPAASAASPGRPK
jgi:FKBP-type peptidyl-prolyl cis-trans isomerase